MIRIEEYRKHEAWSKYIEENFGTDTALMFAFGSDVLMDYIRDEMQELSSKPRGTHIGQLENSVLAEILPKQFLMRYDYEFLCTLYGTIDHLRYMAAAEDEMKLYRVIELLALYLIGKEAEVLEEMHIEGLEEKISAESFGMIDDKNIRIYLYGNWCMEKDDSYHFEHWMDFVAF